MHVEHFGGTAQAEDVETLERILAARFGPNVNEFWLCGGERFPALAIQVKDDVACVHFFPVDQHPGLVCINHDAVHGTVVLYTNTPTEQIAVPAESTVPLASALQAAREFFRTGTLPASLHWADLE